jgi:hypothetical protein
MKFSSVIGLTKYESVDYDEKEKTGFIIYNGEDEKFYVKVDRKKKTKEVYRFETLEEAREYIRVSKSSDN